LGSPTVKAIIQCIGGVPKADQSSTKVSQCDSKKDLLMVLDLRKLQKPMCSSMEPISLM